MAHGRNCDGQRLRPMPVMSKARQHMLGSELGSRSYEMTIISAHREPDVFFEYAKTAKERELK